MKTLKNSLILAMLLIVSSVMAQNKEVTFDIYTTSAAKASHYLLADAVALRDCPSAQCEQLTTLRIGTYVRLLAKTEQPQTINEVCSRWYKVKMGPQIGWIWGGLIAQKAMTSTVDPEVKFFFGEAGTNATASKQYQIRVVKNGVELDRLVFKAYALSASDVRLDTYNEEMPTQDLIRLSPEGSEDLIIFWENGYLRQLSNANVSLTEESDAYFAEMIEE